MNSTHATPSPARAEPTASRTAVGIGSSDLLAELVFYGTGGYGNYALCGQCGARCGREGCRTCDESGVDDGETCGDCFGTREQHWCDQCGQITGWMPSGQRAPVCLANQ